MAVEWQSARPVECNFKWELIPFCKIEVVSYMKTAGIEVEAVNKLRNAPRGKGVQICIYALCNHVGKNVRGWGGGGAKSGRFRVTKIVHKPHDKVYSN